MLRSSTNYEVSASQLVDRELTQGAIPPPGHTLDKRPPTLKSVALADEGGLVRKLRHPWSSGRQYSDGESRVDRNIEEFPAARPREY